MGQAGWARAWRYLPSVSTVSALHTSASTTAAPELAVLCCWLKVAGKKCGWCRVAGLGLAAVPRRHSADFSHESCVQYLRSGLQPPHRATARQYRTHTHLTHPQPTRPADISAGANKYFVFAIKYFLMALNKSAPGPMSVSIPGWWWPGGAAGRAVTQIRARCGGRGGAARSCAQPGHQLASCAVVCPNNLIPAATFTFHLYPRTRTFSNFRASAQCYPRLELPCTLPWR